MFKLPHKLIKSKYLYIYQIKEKGIQNSDENSKHEVADVKKIDNKGDENTLEESLETKKKIVETITESVVKDSKLIFFSFNCYLLASLS